MILDLISMAVVDQVHPWCGYFCFWTRKTRNREELELSLVENNIEIVAECETHLDPCIRDSQFIPPSYTYFWKDRKAGWVGVIITTKNELIAEKITSSRLSEIVEVKATTQRQPIIAALYRPPKTVLVSRNNWLKSCKAYCFSVKIYKCRTNCGVPYKRR